MTGVQNHHYALEAATLLMKGRDHLNAIILCDQYQHSNLLDLDQSLRSVQQFLHGHLLQLLGIELQDFGQGKVDDQPPNTIDITASVTKSLLGKKSKDTCPSTSGLYNTRSSTSNINIEGTASSSLQQAVIQLRRVTKSNEVRKRRLSIQTKHLEQQERQLQPSMRHYVRSADTTLIPSSRNLSESIYGFNAPRVDATLSEKIGDMMQNKNGHRLTNLNQSNVSDLLEIASTSAQSYSPQTSNSINMRRSSEDYLLFRLIIILQLCLVRIEEADDILCKRKIIERQDEETITSYKKNHHTSVECSDDDSEMSKDDEVHSDGCVETQRAKRYGYSAPLFVSTLLSSSFLFTRKYGVCFNNYMQPFLRKERCSVVVVDKTSNESALSSTLAQASKAIVLVSTVVLLRRGWRILCMNARLENTVILVEDWLAQWRLFESIGGSGNGTSDSIRNNHAENGDTTRTLIAHEQQCRRLLQMIPVLSTRASVWQQIFSSDTGALRLGMIKYFMDLVYASVGTAMQVLPVRHLNMFTGQCKRGIEGDNYSQTSEGQKEETQTYWKRRFHRLLMPLTTAAAASYYAIVGPSSKSAQVTSSSLLSLRLDTPEDSSTHEKETFPDLLRNTWGMVSLPAVKSLSLQVSRLLKGAAVAERIVICGVPCFILSQGSCPEMVIALKRDRRHQERRRLSKLQTIVESTDIYDEMSPEGFKQPTKKVVTSGDYPMRDIILHLTGGGFFAHTIAGDVPFLLDWSASCNAIVIIPEYSLLPENTFPTALDEIVKIYVALRNDSQVSMLGFRANSIVVTGESTGGNLVAALCVKLCIGEMYVSSFYHTVETKDEFKNRAGCQDTMRQKHDKVVTTPMPDAIMFCCPVLNLSLEISPSRIFGKKDPVLPSSLLPAISDAYAPRRLGIQKTDPLVSPYFAPDEILRLFPSTLLYASSEDPFLDDSVTFNSRLRTLGVDSDLRATRHMAHAFWGLGTAGFPEAKQAQRECQEWLKAQFERARKKKRSIP